MNPFRLLTSVLERLRIPYLIGGSHASSVRGVSRPTMDVDLVAAIAPFHAAPLAEALGRNWYAEASQMRAAIERGQWFNLIFIPTAEKFDVFPATGEFQAQQLQRATCEDVEFAGETIACPVATAEDILLAKLQWYRPGGEASERQWNDILGILSVNTSIDLEYLTAWAARLRVSDLLARALDQQGRAQ
jgi:hypothetical protein